MDGEKYCDMLSENENEKIESMVESDNELNYKKLSDITITSNGKILVDDLQGLKTLDDINNSNINNDLQLEIKYRHSFPRLELSVNKDVHAKQHKIQEYLKKNLFSNKILF